MGGLQRQSITSRITAMSLSIVLLALTMTTGFGLYYSLGENRKEALTQVELLSEEKALALEAFVGKQVGYLEGQAKALEVSADFTRAYMSSFTRALVDNNAFAAYAYFCTLKDSGHFTSSDGWIPPPDYSWENKPWVAQTAQSERILFDAPSYDSVTQKIVTVMRKRIVKVAGDKSEVAGILVMALDLKQLSEFMASMQLPEGFKTILIDAKGNAIQYGDPELLVNEKQATPIRSLITDFDSAQDRFTRGVQSYVGRRLNFSDWKLYIEYPTAHIYKDAFNTFAAYVGIFSLVLMAALFLTRRLANQLTTPLLALTDQVKRVASGDYDRDFSPELSKRQDELGTLSKDFDFMRQEIRRRRTESEYKSRVIQEMNDSLEIKISERTMELTAINQELEATLESLTELQGQLIQSQRMASLGSVVSAISHEINTPLGTLFTGISMLEAQSEALALEYREGQLSREALEEYFAIVTQWFPQYHRTYQRLQQLLEAFSLLSGQYIGEGFQQFDVMEVLRDLVALKGKSGRLKGPETAYLTGIPMVYYLVFEKLIDNAKDHGCPLVEGASKSQNLDFEITVTEEGSQLTVIVDDFGPGFNPSIVDKAFEPFITSKRDQGHLGLGLSVVYNLVHSVPGGLVSLGQNAAGGARVQLNFPYLNPKA